MTERIGNLFTESVEIAITHIDSLFIVGEIHIFLRFLRFLLFLFGLEVHAGTHSKRRHLELVIKREVSIRRRIAIFHGKRHG